MKHVQLGLADLLVGEYHSAGRAAVSGMRLDLNMDGTAAFYQWRDMGGRWDRIAQGRYTAGPEGMIFHREPPAKPWWPADRLSSPFAIERVMGRLVLVPAKELVEFRRAIASPDLWTDFFSRGLYFKLPLPRLAVCRDVTRYENVLTLGRAYLVRDESQEFLRIATDAGRLRLFPRQCFAEVGGSSEAQAGSVAAP